MEQYPSEFDSRLRQLLNNQTNAAEALRSRYPEAASNVAAYATHVQEVLDQTGLAAQGGGVFQRLGEVMLEHGHLDAAIRYFTESLKRNFIGPEPVSYEVAFQSLHDLGVSYLRKDRTDVALDFTQRALQLAQARSDQSRLSDTNYLLYQLFVKMGNQDRARRYLEASGRTADGQPPAPSLATMTASLDYHPMLEDVLSEGEHPNLVSLVKENFGQALADPPAYIQRSLQALEQHGQGQQSIAWLNALGFVMVDSGHPQVAQRYFRESLGRNYQKGEPQNWQLAFEAFRELGRVCLELKQTEAALEFTQKALMLADHNGVMQYKSLAHYQLSDIFESLGNEERATFHLAESMMYTQQASLPMQREEEPSAPSVPYDDRLADVLRHEAANRTLAAQFGEAFQSPLVFIEHALKVMQDNGLQDQGARYFLTLGMVVGESREDLAPRYYSESLRLNYTSGANPKDWPVAHQTFMSLGYLNLKQNRTDVALEYAQRGLFLARDNKDTARTAQTHQLLHEIFRQMGDEKRAAYHLSEIDRVNQDAGAAPKTKATPRFDRRLENLLQGQTKALDALQSAYADAVPNPMRYSEHLIRTLHDNGLDAYTAEALSILGSALADLQHYDSSTRYYSESLRLNYNGQANPQVWEAAYSAFMGLGRVHINKKRADVALEYTQRALYLARDQKNEDFTSQAHLQLSMVFELMGDSNRAKQQLELSQTISFDESGAAPAQTPTSAPAASTATPAASAPASDLEALQEQLEKAQRQVSDAEYRIKLLLQSLPLAVVATDNEGNIAYWNREAERITGMPASMTMGHPPRTELPGPRNVERSEVNIKNFSNENVSLEWSDASSKLPISGWSQWGYARLQDSSLAQIETLQDKVKQLETRNKELEARSRQEVTDVRGQIDANTRDAMTSLYNRRYIDQQLPFLIEKSQRTNTYLSLAAFDIDNLRTINESYSYEIGDDVIKAFTNILKEEIGPAAILARYGSEELVAVMLNTVDLAAYQTCEKVRNAVEAYDWTSIAPNLVVTVSAGISCTAQTDEPENLLRLAMEAMRDAKSTGKNKVVIS
ncbi:diguanylate cyclase [Deinococcus cellulosilyticus]|uniref:Diguanylate cyclase n=1 Tax=Deinococcus cellulosilyticus (strain DSM 18568 / NBRC 106333 / KACC 11606 / 5516J-15) TaxID=1223518 RepID=A0A511MYP7_DEIC1|nr:diguanylate cyclase [Deinococcus cellulosilyticus]GEM45720.1 hypothetical protein DC3_13550 [Deinococcus cellulosilyticus NBRC 106333 = KACC 11606]